MDTTRLDEFINKMSADMNAYVRELHEKQLIADIILIYRTYGDYEEYKAHVEKVNNEVRKYNDEAMIFKVGEPRLYFNYRVERPILSKRIFDFIKTLSSASLGEPLPYSVESEIGPSLITDTTSTVEAMEEYRKFMDRLYTDCFKWSGVEPEPIIVREPLCEDERGED